MTRPTKPRSNSGKFVILPDGRKLPKPPSGGQFSKPQIRRAVRRAAETQRNQPRTG